MRYAKIMGLAVAWVASCGVSYYIGTASRQQVPRPASDDGGVSATVVTLPPRKFVSLVGESTGDYGPRANIFRSNLKLITSAKIWSSMDQSSLSASFFEDSGSVKYVRVASKEGHSRDWGFREDGSVEYFTVYKYDGAGTAAGERRHLDSNGNLTRTEHITEHGRP